MKVGLCGYAQVGKDTCAAHMPGYQRWAFADALKIDATAMLAAIGVTADWADPAFKERWRPLLVALGAGMRATDPDYWIKRLIYQMVRKGVQAEDNVVITDVRYPNEVQWVLSKGGVVIRLERPGYCAANIEEAHSFYDIDEKYPKLPIVINEGSPADMAGKVLFEIQRARM